MVRSRLVLNMAYNIGGATLPMLVSLVTVPLYTATIGTDRYGIVAIAWLLGYFGSLDFGLSRATANALSRLTDESDERARILVTSFCLNMALGALAALLLFFVLDPLTEHVFTVPPGLSRRLPAPFHG